MSDFEKIISEETKSMSTDEFTNYIQKKLIPACNQQWGKGKYLIMQCNSDDLVVAPTCEECDLPKADDRYYITICDEFDGDIEDIILIDAYDDNDYGLAMAVDVDDCCCDS